MYYRNEITPGRQPVKQRYPWHRLEEYRPDGGMWSIPLITDKDRFVEASAALMANPAEFKAAMERAIVDWPLSAAVALTTTGLNHRAWLGHAGCYLATGSPEETTRLGWHELDDAEQWAANQAADSVIHAWREAHKLPQPVQLDFAEDWGDGDA